MINLSDSPYGTRISHLALRRCLPRQLVCLTVRSTHKLQVRNDQYGLCPIPEQPSDCSRRLAR